jgi:hypothetical protein
MTLDTAKFQTGSARLASIMVASAVLTLMVSSCSAVRVTTDYDTGRSFASYRTWTWVPGPRPQTGDPHLDNDLLDRRVRGAVERELAARGFQKVERDPSFFVEYHTALASKVQVRSIGSIYGYGPGDWDPVAPGGTFARTYDEGSLIVDIVDAESRELVWRGIARAEVYPTDSPAEREREINEAVRKILERFPPA